MSNAPFSGTWHNEEGSELQLEAAPDGKLSGRFHSGVGFGGDQRFEVTGFAAGSLVVFSVNLGKYGSLTSWVGHFIDGELQTLWQMTLELSHPRRADELWRGIWSGADNFRQGPAPAGLRGKRRGRMLPLWSE